jgi:predicted HicB family RNase H-like nuclease
LRISPELHEQLAIAAQAEGKSINLLAQEALRSRVMA